MHRVVRPELDLIKSSESMFLIALFLFIAHNLLLMLLLPHWTRVNNSVSPRCWWSEGCWCVVLSEVLFHHIICLKPFRYLAAASTPYGSCEINQSVMQILRLILYLLFNGVPYVNSYEDFQWLQLIGCESLLRAWRVCEWNCIPRLFRSMLVWLPCRCCCEWSYSCNRSYITPFFIFW